MQLSKHAHCACGVHALPVQGSTGSTYGTRHVCLLDIVSVYDVLHEKSCMALLCCYMRFSSREFNISACTLLSQHMPKGMRFLQWCYRHKKCLGALGSV
jgi:hypothetical protein